MSSKSLSRGNSKGMSRGRGRGGSKVEMSRSTSKGTGRRDFGGRGRGNRGGFGGRGRGRGGFGGRGREREERLELDDEEIDSDEADGIQDSEDDEEIEEEEGELADFMREDEENNFEDDEKDLTHQRRSSKQESEDEEEESEYEEEENEDEESEEDEENEENEDETKLDQLKSMIEDLNRKRQPLQKEILPESTMNINTKDNQVTLDSLMSVINDETGFGEFKKQISNLQKTKSRDEFTQPLSTPAKERIERSAAYQESKKEITKWSPFVSQMRKQEHVEFPLYAPKQEVTSAALAVKFEPEVDFEKEIDNILRTTGMHDDNLKQTEELALNDVTEEEVRKRREELVKMRNLLFYQELKSKRQKKIKSKTYHKILKKQKERAKMSLEELREINPEEAMLEEARRETDRALERITQRHSKSKSKFSRTANLKNDRSREYVNEQLKLKEQLKRKIDQVHSEDDEEDPESGSHDKYDMYKSEETMPELPKKGLLAMKFIQKNIISQKVDTETENLERDATFSEILMQGSGKSGKGGDVDDEAVEEARFLGSSAVVEKVGMSGGVRVKTAQPLTVEVDQKVLFEVEDFPDIPQSNLNRSVIPSPAKKQKVEKKKKKDDEVTVEKDVVVQQDLEWNVTGNGTLPTEKQEDEDKVDKRKKRKEQDDDVIPLQAKSNKKQKTEQESLPDPSENPWMVPAEESKTRHTKKMYNPDKNKQELQVNLEDAISLQDKDKIKPKKGKKTFDLLGDANAEQRALIQEAFAGDDTVLEDFQAEKDALMMDEDKPVDDGVLPGWGSWLGDGVKESQKKNKLPAPEKEKKEKKTRTDEKLMNVIINEKRLKKTIKYMVPELPKPFTNREQFDRMQRQVVGKDWNPVKTFDQLIKPAIIVKPGTAIEPITPSAAKTYLFSKTDYQKEEKKKEEAREKRRVKALLKKKKEKKD